MRDSYIHYRRNTGVFCHNFDHRNRHNVRKYPRPSALAEGRGDVVHPIRTDILSDSVWFETGKVLADEGLDPLSYLLWLTNCTTMEDIFINSLKSRKFVSAAYDYVHNRYLPRYETIERDFFIKVRFNARLMGYREPFTAEEVYRASRYTVHKQGNQFSPMFIHCLSFKHGLQVCGKENPVHFMMAIREFCLRRVLYEDFWSEHLSPVLAKAVDQLLTTPKEPRG